MKRGRKSDAERTTRATQPPMAQRPEPPPTLDADGRARWSEIVDPLPADYFRASDLQMLEGMIRTERYVTECDELIEANGHLMKGPGKTLVTNPAVTARRGYIATIATIQRALRLCPSTRLDKTSAKLREASSAKRPWEPK